LDLNGETLLSRLINRVKLSNYPIYILTSDDRSDDVIERVASNLGVKGVFRGSLNNVRDRFFQAAKFFNINYIVRVTADNPLTEPVFISEAFQNLESGANYTRVYLDRCPEGTNVEGFTFSELEKSVKLDIGNKDLYDQEHVTPRIIERNIGLKNFLEFESRLKLPLNVKDYSFTVDNIEDYLKILQIYSFLDSKLFESSNLLDQIMESIDSGKIQIAVGRNH